MDFEHRSLTERKAPACFRLPLTSLCLNSSPLLPAGSALSPAVLCRGAAPGHSCLSAELPGCHELPPSQKPSPAQQHRTSPRQHHVYPLWPPSRSPGQLAVKQTEAITDIFSLSSRDTISAVALLLSPKELAPSIPFSCPIFRQDNQSRTGRDLLHPC